MCKHHRRGKFAINKPRCLGGSFDDHDGKINTVSIKSDDNFMIDRGKSFSIFFPFVLSLSLRHTETNFYILEIVIGTERH